MNLASNPTKQQLAAMLATLNDEASHHIIWVGHDGEVHIDPLPADLNPVGFEYRYESKIKFRLETCDRGNSYVGRAAAADKVWVNRLFNALLKLWEGNYVGYCDAF